MHETKEIERLLNEIYVLQSEHLAEYRRVTQESLALQRQAVSRQEQVVKTTYLVIVLVVILIVCGAVLLVLMDTASKL